MDAGERRIAARHLLSSPDPDRRPSARRAGPGAPARPGAEVDVRQPARVRAGRRVNVRPLGQGTAAGVRAGAPGPPRRRGQPVHGTTYVHARAGLRGAARSGRRRADPHLVLGRPDPGGCRRAGDHHHRRHQRPAATGHRPEAAGFLGCGDRDRRDADRLGRAPRGRGAAEHQPPAAHPPAAQPAAPVRHGGRDLVARQRRSHPGGGSGSGWWRARRCSGPSFPTTSWTCCPGNATSWPGSWTRTSGWYWRSGPKGALAYDPSSGTGGLTDWSSPAAAAPSRRPCCCSTSWAGPCAATGSTCRVGGRTLPATSAPWARVDTVLGELAARYRPRGRTRTPSRWTCCATEVVGLLTALRLAGGTDDGLAIFPFAARYQPQVTTHSAAREATQAREASAERGRKGTSNAASHGSPGQEASGGVPRPAGSTSAGGCPGPGSSTSGTTWTTSSTSAADG